MPILLILHKGADYPVAAGQMQNKQSPYHWMETAGII